jgi:hypothetical protein
MLWKEATEKSPHNIAIMSYSVQDIKKTFFLYWAPNSNEKPLCMVRIRINGKILGEPREAREEEWEGYCNWKPYYPFESGYVLSTSLPDELFTIE